MALRLHAFASFLSTDVGQYGGASGVTISGGRLAVPMDGSAYHDFGMDFTDLAALAVHWACAEQVAVDSWGGAEGDEVRIWRSEAGGSTRPTLWAVVTGSGYRIRLKNGPTTVLGTGTTVFSFGDANRYGMRIQTDGTRIKVEYGGWLELDVASALQLNVDHTGMGASSNLDATKYIRSGPVHTWSGDSESDRPAIDASFVEYLPNSSTSVHHDQWADVNPGGTAKWDTVNDAAWDDETTWNETTTINGNYSQSYKLPDTAVPSNFRAFGEFARARKTVDAKTATFNCYICDGTNDRTPGNVISSNVFAVFRAAWNLAPDGAAWAQADVDLLELVVRGVFGADVVRIRCTAIRGEAVGVAAGDALSPAPGAAADRRRLLAQVI